jgi:gluconokinase
MSAFLIRSPYDEVGGIVYFGRMLDRIRLHLRGELPAQYHEMFGGGFDERTCDFLHVRFPDLYERARIEATDDELLAWCFATGRQPPEEEVQVWNGFMAKRGWRDAMSQMVREELEARGWLHRTEIQTLFDFFDADEGRPVRTFETIHRNA